MVIQMCYHTEYCLLKCQLLEAVSDVLDGCNKMLYTVLFTKTNQTKTEKNRDHHGDTDVLPF